ncbi:RNA-directed DNA polymerase [Bradyrhizobium sp. UFLA05-153]
MHSPKFPLKAKGLKDVVNVARLKFTWKHKVREAMRRQPIPDPVENLDFHTRIDACVTIEGEVLSAAYIPNTPTRLLSEKSKGLCRQLVIPSVKDALILQTLSDALWAEIRVKAPTKKSFYAPGDHQFSKVVKGSSLEYGSINAWLAFQKSIFGFAKSKKFIVVTDIANYYDSISYDHLRNILADQSLAREHALDLLIYTLSCMLWQPDYMPRVPVGLPQSNLDAPRLLAHTFLFEIDEWLANLAGVDFARYMDDMDIGVDSIQVGRAVLRDLDLALQTRQIRLNSGKTRILSERQAEQHFKIRENLLLDKLSDLIEKKKSLGLSLTKERRKIELAIGWGLKRGRFADGNGEKILKRLINFARQTRSELADDTFYELLRDWPAVRQVLLTWWQHKAGAEDKLPLIAKLLHSGSLVDDASKVDVAVAIVAARLPKNPVTEWMIQLVLGELDEKTTWGLYAKIWLLSRYGSIDELMSVVEKNVTTWVIHEPLSRLVGGLFPRFLATPLEAKFDAILRRAGNSWSSSVFSFHRQLAIGTAGYASISKFVLTGNPSLPNRLTHSKFLMLLSLLKSTGIKPAATSHLAKVHTWALSDQYYATMV